MKQLLLISLLLTNCSHTFHHAEKSLVRSKKKSDTYGKPVRKSFVIMKGFNDFCDYENTNTLEIKEFTASVPPPTNSDGKLLMALGEATCEDTTETKQLYDRVWTKSVWGLSYEDKFYEDNTRTYGNRFSDIRNPKQPASGQVVFYVGDQNETQPFITDFKNSNKEYAIATVAFPKILRDAINRKLENNRPLEDVKLTVKYKDATMHYLFLPELYNKKCKSLEEGVEPSEANCKPYHEQWDKE